MRYPDGQLARLGDRLRLWDGVERTIVCSLNTDEYSAAYPRSEWDCLKTGVLVHSAQTGRHVEHRVPRLRLDLCDTGAHALVAPLFGLTLLQRRHGRSDRCRRSFVLPILPPGDTGYGRSRNPEVCWSTVQIISTCAGVPLATSTRYSKVPGRPTCRSSNPRAIVISAAGHDMVGCTDQAQPPTGGTSCEEQ
jgi:hypothetical protein